MDLDTDKLAQELYDRSLVAKEVQIADLRKHLATAHPGHETIDEPELYRWFFIPDFPTKSFGITLNAMLKEAGSAASQEKWQHDRIIDLLKSGQPEWPAIVTATGIIVDGYHRIAAHRTLRDDTMGVVVGVRKEPMGGYYDEWDTLWNEAFP